MADNEKSLSNKAAQAGRDANTAKNLVKAAGKLAAQDYVGAALDATKELLSNPEFLFKLAIISCIPFIILVCLIVSPFAMLYSTINDAPDDYIGTNTTIGFGFNETVKSEVTKIVTKAYDKAHNSIKMDIGADAMSRRWGYTTFEYTINSPIDTEGIPDTEIAKIYACFSVLKEREHLSTDYTETVGGMGYFNQEKDVFDKEKLVDILNDNRDKLFTWTVTDNSWTETDTYDYTDPITEEVYSIPYTIKHGVFVYDIYFVDTTDMARDVFGLEDNSGKMEIEEKLRYDEIKMALDKEETLNVIMNGEVKDQYVVSGSTDIVNTISQYKADGITVDDVNFVTTGMEYPLHGYPMKLNSPFGPRNLSNPPGASKYHRGLDFGAPSGTPIYSFANGVVLSRGYNDSMGNFIVVYHGTAGGYDYATIYMHMVQPALVNTGDQVTSETQIGKVGTTGTSSGNHLHFGLMKGLPGEELSYVDPMPYIN